MNDRDFDKTDHDRVIRLQEQMAVVQSDIGELRAFMRNTVAIGNQARGIQLLLIAVAGVGGFFAGAWEKIIKWLH